MGDHERTGLLAEEEVHEDPLREVSVDDDDSPLDTSGTDSDLVSLSENGASSSNAPGKKKKKKVVRKKKKKNAKKTTAADGVDQAPVNPDDLEHNGQDQDGYHTTAFDHVESIENHAAIVTQILVPVCITMTIVITLVKLLNPPETMGSSSALSLYFEKAGDSNAQKFGGALLNALIFVAAIVVVTCIFVVLYKYRCLKILFGWLGLSTILLLGGGFGTLLWQTLTVLNMNLDWISFGLLVWNFGVVGMIATFWHAPVKVNQFYMICVSSLMAVLFTRLPEWTTWTILAAIAIYDLFAVLCPRGPLRVLVETAQERNENIPALLYNTFITFMATPSSGPLHLEVHDDEDEEDVLHAAPSHHIGESEDHAVTLQEAIPSENGAQENAEHAEAHPHDDGHHEEQERSGVKLGLGDFIFYSVLVGRAALFDMLTVFTSFVGIVTGLFGTILLLALWKKALPALPLSILFGVIFFFASRFLLLPFATSLTLHGVAM